MAKKLRSFIHNSNLATQANLAGLWIDGNIYNVI